MNKNIPSNISKKEGERYFAIALTTLILVTVVLFFIPKSSAQAPAFFMPNFPTRLMYIAENIDNINQRIIGSIAGLKQLVDDCGCDLSESECKQIITGGKQVDCQPVRTIGSTCSLFAQGEETQNSIRGATQHINSAQLDLAYFRDLLIKEKGSGLDRQLETLRQDDAQALDEAIKNIIGIQPDFTDGALYQIITKAKDSITKPEQCSAQNCTPQCRQGGIGSGQCISATISGEQRPTQITFMGSVGVDDWELGKVGVTNIKLNLPESIPTPALLTLKLPKIKILIPEIKIDCPLNSQEIEIKSPRPSLPTPPKLELSCPTYNTAKNYTGSAGIGQDDERYREFEWYLEVFSWLSGKCMEAVLGDDIIDTAKMKDPDKLNDAISQCFNPVTATDRLVNECNNQINLYNQQGYPPPAQICKDDKDDEILRIIDRIGNAEEKCYNLHERCSPGTKQPQIPNEYCNYLYPYPDYKDKCEPGPIDLIEPITTLTNICTDLQKAGLTEVPLECKILPIFDYAPRQIAGPDILELFTPQFTLFGETMIDLPNNPMQGCPIGAPSIPKLPLSQFSIIIPDIKLPEFKLGPFFRVDLPDFIFEDLTFPDIELCNLDNCQFKFPNLSFQPPNLTIPEIKVPAIKLNDIPGIPDILGDPNIEVIISPPEFSPLNFDFSQIINLNSLVSPEIQMPDIEFPKPKLELSFEELNVDLLNLLLGFLKIPNFSDEFSMCINWGALDIIPIDFSYPNYIFSWPDFPDIPEISFCETAREYCKNANDAIQEITGKAKEIETIVDEAVDSKIQQKLNAAANEINIYIANKIKDELQDPVDGIAAKIKEEINAWLLSNPPKSITLPPAPIPGVFPVAPGNACEGVPPLTINLDDIFDIDIGEIDINQFLRDQGISPLPSTIDLKNIWPDDLKNIELSCKEGLCNDCVDTATNNNCSDPSTTGCPSFKDWAKFSECQLNQRVKTCKSECKSCLSYELPSVPLCGLSYSREETINLPGFQLESSPVVSSIKPLGEGAGCFNEPPTTKPGVASACGTASADIQSNINEIQIFSQQINEASKKIKDVLQ